MRLLPLYSRAMCSPTHRLGMLSPSALHLYHFTSWCCYPSPFFLSLRLFPLTVHTTAWLTFARAEGIHAEQLQSRTLELQGLLQPPRRLSFTANSLSSFLSQRVTPDLWLSLTIYALPPLSLSSTSHCVYQHNGSPPHPTSSFTVQSRPP